MANNRKMELNFDKNGRGTSTAKAHGQPTAARAGPSPLWEGLEVSPVKDGCWSSFSGACVVTHRGRAEVSPQQVGQWGDSPRRPWRS